MKSLFLPSFNTHLGTVYYVLALLDSGNNIVEFYLFTFRFRVTVCVWVLMDVVLNSKGYSCLSCFLPYNQTAAVDTIPITDN